MRMVHARHFEQKGLYCTFLESLNFFLSNHQCLLQCQVHNGLIDT